MEASAAAPQGEIPADPRRGSLEEIRRLLEADDAAGAETAARAQIARIESEGGAGTPEMGDALDLLHQSLSAAGRSSSPEALAAARRALAIRETALGEDHPSVAASLLAVGRSLAAIADYAGARDAYARALALREKALGPDHIDLARTASLLAGALMRLGDYPAARAADQRALALRERHLGPDDPLVARSLGNLARLLDLSGDLRGAVPLLERAVAILEAAPEGGGEDLPEAVCRLALVRSQLGEFDAAESGFKRALAILERSGGLETSLASDVFNGLGVLHKEKGDYAEARALFVRAMMIRKVVYGSEHPVFAQSLNNLGTISKELGEDDAARSWYEKALAIREARLGPRHPDVARTLMNLANLLKDSGDFAAARPHYERALSIREEKLGTEHRDVATTLTNLCDLLISIGDLDEALRACERGLGIREKALGPDHPITGESLHELGMAVARAGDLRRSRSLHEQALALWERAYGSDHPYAGRAHGLIGDRLLAAGDPEAARIRYMRSLEILRRAYGDAHPILAEALVRLAALHLRTNEIAQAMEEALELERITREHFRRAARSLSNREALRYEAVRVAGFDVLLTALATAEPGSLPADAVRRVWGEMTLSRALVLDEIASRHRGEAAANAAEIAPLRADLTASRAAFARIVVAGPDPERGEEYQDRVRKAQSDVDRAERALAAASSPFREEVERKEAGLDVIAARIEVGTALVGYARYSRLTGAPESGGPAPNYTAFVLTAGDPQPAFVPLGPAARIEKIAARWREELGAGARNEPHAGGPMERRYRAAGAALREAIWDPVASRLDRARRVFVVPDGLLNLVNFATLPVEEDRYLIETGPLIHLISSERDLARRAGPFHGDGGLLVLANPDFNAAPPPRTDPASTDAAAGLEARGEQKPAVFRGAWATCGAPSSLRFDPLPGARAEGEDIASLWRASSGAGPRGPVRLLTGRRADEGSLKALAGRFRVLHLATHAFFFGDQCTTAPAAARDAGRAELEPWREPSRVEENILLLTGLALAGANRREEASDDLASEDGILTAEEVAALDLSGVEWAVLSGCETAVGPVMAGEGVLGLRRAFEMAGAGTVIMSLWPVDDRSAWEWMRGLYEGRAEGLSTAEAVRDAGLRMIHARRRRGASTHPSYWGAFVAAGDWR